LSSLTLSLTIGQASSIEGEVFVQLSAALLATRLVDVPSTQCPCNPLGYPMICQINSRSSFIKPLRSRTSGVAFCRTSTLCYNLSGPRNWLIIVFSLPRSYQVDRTCHRLYYLFRRITCSVTTDLERLPTSLQDALQINPRRLKNPLRLSPGH
jgi:hypothetical protein